MSGHNGHEWMPGPVIHGSPTMACANLGCRILWWPDRREPKSTCEHSRDGLS